MLGAGAGPRPAAVLPFDLFRYRMAAPKRLKIAKYPKLCGMGFGRIPSAVKVRLHVRARDNCLPNRRARTISA